VHKYATYHHQQQQLVHHHASLLQNKYNLSVALKIKAEEVDAQGSIPADIIEPKTRISEETYFLLCQSCFWCASYISPQIPNRITKQVITKCPSCIVGNIESLPIAENEEYRFGYDTKRGVTMEFLQ
jgi:hypothetical protein